MAHVMMIQLTASALAENLQLPSPSTNPSFRTSRGISPPVNGSTACTNNSLEAQRSPFIQSALSAFPCPPFADEIGEKLGRPRSSSSGLRESVGILIEEADERILDECRRVVYNPPIGGELPPMVIAHVPSSPPKGKFRMAGTLSLLSLLARPEVEALRDRLSAANLSERPMTRSKSPT